jgi:phosphoinositide-3-kinase regulatory subunit 4
VSASADGAAKVWDCRRLERDISFRSRLTYSAHAAGVTAVAALAGGGGAQVATGGAEGSVHVWRVERAGERGGGILGVRQIDPGGRGAVLDLAACGPHVVAASLAVGGVAGWDLRAGGGAPAWALPAPPGEGAVGRFCCDPGEGPAWVVTGTTRGEVRLWDLRFLLPVARWRHPAGAGVAAMALAAAAPGELGVAAEGGPPAGPLLFVAAGEGEVGLWDAGDGACRAVLRVLRPGALEPERRQPPAALAAPAPAPRALDVMGRAKQLGLGDLAAPQPRAGAVRALLPTAGGQLLAAGADRVVRCWDCARPQHSYPVMAPPPGPRESEAALRDAAAAAASGGGGDPAAAAAGGPRWSFAYAARRVAGVAVVEETRTVEVCGEADREPYAAWGERAAALCHGQAVTDLAAVQGAAERLLVTAGLDGVVKVWR